MTLCVRGAYDCDMPSSNKVWSGYLLSLGYKRYLLPESCPDCYTVKDFCADHKQGSYLLSIGNHVVTVISGNYYDAWDSGNETPVNVYTMENLYE